MNHAGDTIYKAHVTKIIMKKYCRKIGIILKDKEKDTQIYTDKNGRGRSTALERLVSNVTGVLISYGDMLPRKQIVQWES